MIKKIFLLGLISAFYFSFLLNEGFASTTNFGAGTWQEISTGSASSSGISGYATPSYYSDKPAMIYDTYGNLYIAWQHYKDTYASLYIKKFDGANWSEVGAGSASGDGISTGSLSCFYPVIALDSAQQPYVAWANYNTSTDKGCIYVRRFNGTSWIEVGTGSASGSGISGWQKYMYNLGLALDSSNKPYILWCDYRNNIYQIYGKYFNGSAWLEIVPGSSSGNGMCYVAEENMYPIISFDKLGNLIVMWSGWESSDNRYYSFVRKYTGTTWTEIGAGSSTRYQGIDNSRNLWLDSFALKSDNNPIISVEENYQNTWVIRCYNYDGTNWEEFPHNEQRYTELSNSISGSRGYHSWSIIALTPAEEPIIIWSSSGNRIFCCWNRNGQWARSGWSNEFLGISNNSNYPNIAVNNLGNAVVSWSENFSSGEYATYVKTFIPGTPEPVNEFEATAYNNSISLRWRYYNGEPDGFLLVRRTDNSFTAPTNGINYPDGNSSGPGGRWCKNISPSNTIFIDDSVTNGIHYYYRIYAYANNYFYSDGIDDNATPQSNDVAPPNPIDRLKISGTDSIELKWRDSLSSDVIGILIVRKDNNSFSDPINGEVYSDGNSSGPGGSWCRNILNGIEIFNDSTVQFEKRYWYKLYTKDAANNYSSGVSISGGLKEFEEVGNPVLGEPSTAQTSWDQHTWRDRLYIGYGDWNNNTGPTHVLYYDRHLDNFKGGFRVDDESIDRYYSFDNILYIPGVDAREAWTWGNVYRNTGDGWIKFRTLPNAIHVFCMGKYQGNLYAGTREWDAPNNTAYGKVLVSRNDGETWTETSIPDDDYYTGYFNMFVHKGNLYAQGTNLYKYDGTSWTLCSFPFNLYNIAYYISHGAFLDYEAFVDKESHTLQLFTETGTTEPVWSREHNSQDLEIFNNELFVLDIESVGSQFRGTIYSTTDLNEWHLRGGAIFSFMPTTLSIYDNRFYIGDNSGFYWRSKEVVDNKLISISTPHHLNEGDFGVYYSKQLTASGGNGENLNWSVISGELCDGINLSPSGLLSGTVSTTGTFQFTVQALSSEEKTTKTIELVANLRPIREESGLFVFEAEDYDSCSYGILNENWLVKNDVSGYSGKGYLQLLPDLNQLKQPDWRSAKFGAIASWRLYFETAGTYFIWLRGKAPNTNGNLVHCGLNRIFNDKADSAGIFSTSQFDWVTSDSINNQRLTIEVNSIGFHTFNISKALDGVIIDKIIITQDDDYFPTGIGPAATRRETPENVSVSDWKEIRF